MPSERYPTQIPCLISIKKFLASVRGMNLFEKVHSS